MRTAAAAALLGLGALVALVANVGLWVDRTVYDTDGFVSTVDGVFDDKDVQQAIATRFTAELFEGADIQGRLRQELPEGLGFLALPLTTATQDFLTDVSLRVLERQPLRGVRNSALRELHSELIATIEGERGVEVEDDKLVIDLRAALDSVVEDIGFEGGATGVTERLQDAEVPGGVEERLPPDVQEQLNGDGGLLEGLQLREDAGTFVIEDSGVAWAYRIARYGNDIIWAIVGVAAGLLAAAVLVARDRRSMLRNVGVTLAVVGTLSLILLVPVRLAAREFAEEKDAAVAIINVISSPYQAQSFVMIGVGLATASGAALFGNTRLARAIRFNLRRSAASAGERESIVDVVRDRAPALRVGGLVGAALVLVAWPDPTLRVYLTALSLLGVYLAALWLVSSDGDPARRLRARLRDAWERYFASGPAGSRPPGFVGWVGGHAMWLRAAGIVVAAGLLIFWPDVKLGSIIAVVALLLAYLAAVDFVAGRGSSA